jgi:hypothetical protein
MSDPKIPKNYRHFKFKKGAATKVTDSGKVTPLKPAERWHSVQTPSSFYWIDAMCSYKQIRTGSGDEPSYALDPILNKHLKIGKLKFEQADKYTGLEWHFIMQKNYPLEYIVYNIFDCVSMEMLDEKTLDLSVQLPMYSGISDFQNFKSQPRRAVDALHFYCLKNDKVIGCTGEDMKDDDDALISGLSQWITMLPSHLVYENGLKIIEEHPDIHSSLRMYTGDLDVSASYNDATFISDNN